MTDILDVPPVEAAEVPVQEEPVEFFMVWTKWGHAPRRTHNTREVAQAEAGRLARLYAPKKFIVLQAVTKISAAPVTA